MIEAISGMFATRKLSLLILFQVHFPWTLLQTNRPRTCLAFSFGHSERPPILKSKCQNMSQDSGNSSKFQIFESKFLNPNWMSNGHCPLNVRWSPERLKSRLWDSKCLNVSTFERINLGRSNLLSSDWLGDFSGHFSLISSVAFG